MIDLHCHILPGIDDGSQDLAESIKMAQMAYEDGIETIVATPHVDDRFANHPEQIKENVRYLQHAVKRKGIEITLLPGGDIHFRGDLAEQLKKGHLPSINMNGKYILLEIPSFDIPMNFYEMCFELKLAGFSPILTHPERNLVFQQNQKKLFTVMEKDIPIQITASSVAGDFGPEAQRTAEFALIHHLAHSLVTDAHNTERRPPILSAALEKALLLTQDEDYTTWLVKGFPEAVIKGETVVLPEPIYPKPKKSFWDIFRPKKYL